MGEITKRGSPLLLAAIIESLDRDGSKWKLCDATLEHSSRQVSLWIYLGDAYVWEPRKIKFGWLHRRRLRAAIRRWKQANPIDRLDSGADIIRILRGAA